MIDDSDKPQYCLLNFELQTLHYTEKRINVARNWCHKKIWLDCAITKSACNYAFANNYWFYRF